MMVTHRRSLQCMQMRLMYCNAIARTSGLTYLGSLLRQSEMKSLAMSDTPSKSSGGKSKGALVML